MKDTDIVEINLIGLDSLKNVGDNSVTLNTKTIDIIKEIHEELYHDHGFFIFFEGPDIQLRCSHRNKKKVLAWAGRHRINLSEWKKWEEPWPHTKKYQDWYQKLFHIFTQAMFLFDERDCYYALERINHCFLNMQQRNVYPDGKVISGQLNNARTEAMLIASMLVDRAITAGWIMGQNQAAKKAAESKEEKQL